MYLRAVFLATGLVLASGSTSLVSAADIYAPSNGSLKDPVMSEETTIPEATAFQETAEWFIRGDLGVGGFGNIDGYGTSTDGDFGIRNYDPDPVFSGSIGFGRYATPNVRLGLDLDYHHDADSTFKTSGVDKLDNIGVNALEINTLSLMATAIYDFRPNARWSPYIGGGVGWAFHSMKLKGGSYATDLNKDGNPEPATLGGGSDSSSSFAAEFVTGVSLHLRQNLFLDVGYKLAYLGDAETAFTYRHPGAPANPPTIPAVIPASNGTGNISLDDILTHEFRIGLRYDLY